jgi:hypothetical protein
MHSSTIRLQRQAGGATDATVDLYSAKKVTDCAATGALLTTDGTTRGYISLNASFNPNLASTFKVFYIGD